MPKIMYNGTEYTQGGDVNFGSADISSIGDGSVTGAIAAIHSDMSVYKLQRGELLCPSGQNYFEIVYPEAFQGIPVVTLYPLHGTEANDTRVFYKYATNAKIAFHLERDYTADVLVLWAAFGV